MYWLRKLFIRPFKDSLWRTSQFMIFNIHVSILSQMPIKRTSQKPQRYGLYTRSKTENQCSWFQLSTGRIKQESTVMCTFLYHNRVCGFTKGIHCPFQSTASRMYSQTFSGLSTFFSHQNGVPNSFGCFSDSFRNDSWKFGRVRLIGTALNWHWALGSYF